MSESEVLESNVSNTVVVDAMGGDNAPGVVLEGVEIALAADPALSVILAGPDEVVSEFAAKHDRVEALVAPEVIGMDEHPAKAVRSKRNSSIVLGCKAVKEGRAGGFFSAGSTGACLAGATLFVGRIKGVARPALCAKLPGGTVMCDVGANADCKPEYLLQFAQMAVAYSKAAMGVAAPKAALLNIGSEDTKGSQFAQDTFALLKEHVPEFAGNAEGNELLTGRYDVVVTDGFTGNIALKTAEGTAKTLLKAVKGILMQSVLTKIAALIVKPGLKELAASMGSEATGAAPLLGVNGGVYVGHGSSTAREVAAGIAETVAGVRSGLTEVIAAAVAADDADAIQ